MSTNLVRSKSSAAPHSTTIDSAVLGLIVYLVGTEIEGLHEAMMVRAEPVVEGNVENDPPPAPASQGHGAKPTPAVFDHKAEIVIHVKATPFYDVVIPPVIKKLRSAVIERVHALTDLKVHAVHIHIAALRPA